MNWGYRGQGRNLEHQHHGGTTSLTFACFYAEYGHDAYEEALHGATQADTGKQHGRGTPPEPPDGSGRCTRGQPSAGGSRHAAPKPATILWNRPASSCNQPQVTALVQQVYDTPQRQGSQPGRRGKVTAQRVRVLQAQEQGTGDRPHLRSYGGPQLARLLAPDVAPTRQRRIRR